MYAGLPVATVTGDQSYYDSHPDAWAYPYDLPADTISLMNTYTGGTTRTSPALELALALPAMLTAWMLNQPDFGGSVPADGNPIAAISDIGQTVVGQSLSLNASASFDPATGSSSDLTYSWNFGDGTGASGPSVSHTYARNGSYRLTLTVTSPTGTRTISKKLSVGTSPDTYANPYSPLPATNTPNPAVTIPTPDNSLPVQPALPAVQTPTPAPTSAPSPTPTRTPIAPTTAPTATSTVASGPSTFNPTAPGAPLPVIIGLVLVALMVAGALGVVMVRMRSKRGR
jgi:PKD repeat protein